LNGSALVRPDDLRSGHDRDTRFIAAVSTNSFPPALDIEPGSPMFRDLWGKTNPWNPMPSA
jgi:hypothetical protein